MFDYSSYLKNLKIVIDIVMIYFINKETLNMTYNFIYLNKYFK
jgi:hypothetical protein